MKKIEYILSWEKCKDSLHSEAQIDCVKLNKYVGLTDSFPLTIIIKTSQIIITDKEIESVEELLCHLEKLHDDILFEERMLRQLIEKIQNDNESDEED